MDGSWGTSNNADIGQTITFQTIITTGVNASNYILHDKMGEHFEFIEVTGVARGGNVIEATGNYTVDTDPDDDCAFHVIFDENLCTDLPKDATLTVRYTAKLIEGAPTGALKNHTNTAWLTHTDANVPTNESTTTTQTYTITVEKYDNTDPENPVPLEGAGFVLRDNVNKYYHWNETTKSVEWVNFADLDLETDYHTTDADGKTTFKGVDAEDFHLEEVDVPDGYTGQTNILASTKVCDDIVVKVNNVLGHELPETGGIGTTMFYVVGIVLVMGALAALVIFKRKETSAQ